MLFKTLEFIFSYSTIKDLKQKSSISCYTFLFSTLNSIAEIFINRIFRFSRFLVVKLTLTLIDHASLLRQRKDSNLSTDVSLPIAKYVFFQYANIRLQLSRAQTTGDSAERVRSQA